MKNLLSLIVFLFSISSSYAGLNAFSPLESKCRPALTNSIDCLSQVERIQADLLDGLWLHELTKGKEGLGLKELYEFEEFGQLKRTAIFENGHSETNNHLWKIEEIEETAFLVIFDSELREELYYKVTQNCEGILLTDVVNYENTFLSFHREANFSELENIRLRIAGHWTCSKEPFDPRDASVKLEGAFLNYEFDLNGQFTRIMGDAKQKVEEAGFWELSNDGNFLLLKFSKTGLKSDAYTTQYIRLEKVGVNQLEIAQTLTTVGTYASIFCSKQKKILLNKELSSF